VPVDGSGIVIGSAEAVVDQNPNVRLRIIFTGSGKADDDRTATVADLSVVQKLFE